MKSCPLGILIVLLGLAGIVSAQTFESAASSALEMTYNDGGVIRTMQDIRGQGVTGVLFNGTTTVELGAIYALTGVSEVAPRIKLWFGTRAYQKALVAKGEKFVISPTPELKIDLSIDEPYSLASNINAYQVIVDANTAGAKTIPLAASNIASKTFATEPLAGREGEIRTMSLKYAFTDALAPGAHEFTVRAASSGSRGWPGVAVEQASVEVLSGPVRVLGTAVTYPSPFRIAKDKQVQIQYTLSVNAPIDVYVTNVTGARIKHFACEAGTEGGSAGNNKVLWDGQADGGFLAGNGIYIGTIISRDDQRLLSKFKLTIID
jgi:hypothetical protein